jgi:DNA helicase-2/ATP-dependent DNA helicase PcrA
MVTEPHDSLDASEDAELTTIVSEEEQCLARVIKHVQTKRPERVEPRTIDYDRQLLDLRDQIAAARMEDVPPLLEQMERLQHLAARQGQSTPGHIDPRSPYFGRLVLKEDERVREVLIGRSTYLDTSAGVRVVDWRDAPVSRLYYRYSEGDEYEENFGGRDVEGEIVKRRSLTIVDAELRRIVTPQGVFVHSSGAWKRGSSGLRLKGGEGSALRADDHRRPGKLGVGAVDAGEDRHLKEITALIDPRQFELITKPDAGLVVIQGGAGSGKTTIGLHRLAYLAFQDKRRFRPDRMLVIAFNQALVRYISQVLPALDVQGVAVRTYSDWAARLRASHFPDLPTQQTSETPIVVTRLKKHPAMLKAIDEHVEKLASLIEERLSQALGQDESVRADVLGHWSGSADRPLAHRLHGLSARVGELSLSSGARHALEREIQRGLQSAQDVAGAWSELITDRDALKSILARYAPGQFTERELERAFEWCAGKSALVTLALEQAQEAAANPPPSREERGDEQGEDGDEGDGANDLVDTYAAAERHDPAELDLEDDTLLLRLYQRMRGPLLRPSGQDALSYEHVLIDEAQDLSPVELAVLMQTVSRGQSVTLAGDVAQRLHMDNGFSGWESLLAELGLSHVQIEPLEVAYRSTQEVVEVAQAVLGPLAATRSPRATRSGAPVELFRFAHTGDAVGFLAEALRELIAEEPRASVAVIARYPEQASVFHSGLKQAEIPNLRRIAEQDFPFKPGVDVTDVRQVKGLEFDYVVLVDVTESTYPADDEARHLLHIAATRAAHQLWFLATSKPSQLLPESLRERGY